MTKGPAEDGVCESSSVRSASYKKTVPQSDHFQMSHTKLFPSKAPELKRLIVKWSNMRIGTIYMYTNLLSWYSPYRKSQQEKLLELVEIM